MTEPSFEFLVSSKNNPILLASGHEFFSSKKVSSPKFGFAQNIKHIKGQPTATAIREKKNELIRTHGEHNHDTLAGKLVVRNVIRYLKDLYERFTPTVAVASAVLPVTNNLATQFALPTKEKIIQTAARTCKNASS